jgi:hypothetical protein
MPFPRQPFNPQLVAAIRPNMEAKKTETLLAIYQAYDVSRWSPEAFQAIRYILIERGEEIPQPADKLCPACAVRTPGHALECECGYDFTAPSIIEDEPKPFVAHCNLLQFRCNQEWESLDKTYDRDMRYCRKCDQRVYFCRTEEQFRLHARRGHCVALTLMNPVESESEMLTAGIPRIPDPE